MLALSLSLPLALRNLSVRFLKVPRTARNGADGANDAKVCVADNLVFFFFSQVMSTEILQMHV